MCIVRLPESSIFTAEACATDLALNIISKSNNKNVNIFSDSLTNTKNKNKNKLDDPLNIRLLGQLDSMSNTKKFLEC